jgi:hypothetical protein
MPYDWDEISLEEARFLDDILDEIAALEPKISKFEAMAMLNNIGLTDLDGVGLFIGNCVCNSRDWPLAEVLYLDRPSDPLAEFKIECLGLGLRYRFTSEKNTAVVVDISVFRDREILYKKYMELIPPLNRVDMRFILASLSCESDLPPEFTVHLRYLYANTPEAKVWERSDFSDIEEDGLYKHFQDERFHDPIYPVNFSLRSSHGMLSLRSNIENSPRSSLEISSHIPNSGELIPNHDEYIIIVEQNSKIEICFNPIDDTGEFYGYGDLVNLGYKRLGGSLFIESRDGIYAIDSLGDSAEPILFTVDNSTFRTGATDCHTIWVFVNNEDPAKVNKVIFTISGQVTEYNGRIRAIRTSMRGHDFET